jgi:hypothetical protein
VDKWEKMRQEAEEGLRAADAAVDAELEKIPFTPPPKKSPREELEMQLRKARLKLQVCEQTLATSPVPREQEVFRRKTDEARAEVARLEALLAAQPAPPMAAAPVMPAMAPPAMAPPMASPAPGIDHTAFGAVAPVGDAIPFRPGAAPAPPVAGHDERNHMAGATGFMPPLEDLADPIPFERMPPELTVEQYASLCVERALHPGQDAAVAQRYRVLTEQALQSLDAHWRQRFQAEGELHRRWQEAYTQYEAWLRSRG